MSVFAFGSVSTLVPDGHACPAPFLSALELDSPAGAAAIATWFDSQHATLSLGNSS
eukprot:CAMPEP_0119381278 /NCGR_PEP_ID=MMETSP1334-20130426/62832_1 /TAXON_ID=127549 /ORGANISM="Calcidiscus leptoporus, Strain RCC1130" /LENGTH=55 /DNA_ID=CAMNT_0007401359 /DNA_START=16 /DNA_END=180 /DNA_ORIENTATION=-